MLLHILLAEARNTIVVVDLVARAPGAILVRKRLVEAQAIADVADPVIG